MGEAQGLGTKSLAHLLTVLPLWTTTTTYPHGQHHHAIPINIISYRGFVFELCIGSRFGVWDGAWTLGLHFTSISDSVASSSQIRIGLRLRVYADEDRCFCCR